MLISYFISVIISLILLLVFCDLVEGSNRVVYKVENEKRTLVNSTPGSLPNGSGIIMYVLCLVPFLNIIFYLLGICLVVTGVTPNKVEEYEEYTEFTDANKISSFVKKMLN